MITLEQAFFVISWLILLIIIHLSFYPLVKRVLPVAAVPVSWTGGFILVSLCSWYAVLTGLHPIVGFVPVILAFIGSFFFKLNRYYRDISVEWRYYLLFISVFVTFLIVRAYNPDINGAEKFMDHGFIASILRNPLVPPLDPWFSGGKLNVYYYFGHWMIAIPALIIGIPSHILFNLALPTIAALSALNLYGVGNLTLKYVRLLPVLAFFIVNPYFIYLAITGSSSFTLLWDSSRVILYTINEYPLFSFLFGDVHAHVLGIMAQSYLVLMITIAITCWKSIGGISRISVIIFTSLGLSVIPAVNSWDILIWAPIILTAGVCLIMGEYGWYPIVKRPGACISRIYSSLIQNRSRWLHSESSGLLYLILVPVISLAIISPLLLGMYTQGIEGIGFVHSPSSIFEFLMVHGWFLVAFVFSFRSVIRKMPWILLLLIPFFILGNFAAGLSGLLLSLAILRRRGIEDLLAAGGLAVLLFCELFYLADNMGEIYYRMNTVFKLYIGAWILCGTAASVMIGKEIDHFIEKDSGLKSAVIKYCVPVLLCFFLIVPPIVVSTVHGPHTPTLDGMAWLSESHSGDAEAIGFLRTLPGNHVIVEAAGDDYQYTSRISSFSGIPAIIGWQFHEYMWRGNNPEGWYSQRGQDVRTIYEDPTKTIPLMKSYHADLLYVGPEETEKYSVSLPEEQLKVLYKNRDVIIYEYSSHNNESFLKDLKQTQE